MGTESEPQLDSSGGGCHRPIGENLSSSEFLAAIDELDREYDEIRGKYEINELSSPYDPSYVFEDEQGTDFIEMIDAVPQGGMGKFFSVDCALQPRIFDVVSRAENRQFPKIADEESVRNDTVELWREYEYLTLVEPLTLCVHWKNGISTVAEQRAPFEALGAAGDNNIGRLYLEAIIEHLCPQFA